MIENELDITFKEAYAKANASTQKQPADIMLQLYACYKQATRGSNFLLNDDENDVRSAFKLNAWMQISNLTIEEAKKMYIRLVNKHISS
ncbi:MAG: phosphatidylserine decarboxylase [Flavobacteriaceae bacterium]|nr:MAG: phosphatidylserine decarboxylase [Flavobacteriaceae bacterium]